MKDKSRYAVGTYSTAAFTTVLLCEMLFLLGGFYFQEQSKQGDEITKVEASMETLLPQTGITNPVGQIPNREHSRALRFSDKCSPSTACQTNSVHHQLHPVSVTPPPPYRPPQGGVIMAFLGLCFQQGPVLLCLASQLGTDLDVGMKPDRSGPTAH